MGQLCSALRRDESVGLQCLIRLDDTDVTTANAVPHWKKPMQPAGNGYALK